MKTLKLHLISLLILTPLFSFSQGDCSSFFKYRNPEPPYEYNDQSKGAVCVSGNSYDFNLPLIKGKDYRLKFYAAPIFDNRIRFKIIDESSNKTVLDLPGESDSGVAGTSALQEYFNEEDGKMVHPYFDFYPVTSTNLKIIIDVLPAPGQKEAEAAGAKVPDKILKGCITVVILDKPAVDSSF